MTGVLIDFEAVMNSSRSRGIPSVTFASPLPAATKNLAGSKGPSSMPHA